MLETNTDIFFDQSPSNTNNSVSTYTNNEEIQWMQQQNRTNQPEPCQIVTRARARTYRILPAAAVEALSSRAQL